MIDPQELEAAAKDVMQRTGLSQGRVEFGYIAYADGTCRSHFFVSAGSYAESSECHAAGSLGVAVEEVIAKVKHNRATELEKARERVRILEALQAA